MHSYFFMRARSARGAAIGIALTVTFVLSLSAALNLATVNAANAQGAAPDNQRPLMPASDLFARVEQGGLVLIIRHERTEVPSIPDDYARPPDECRAQRNLSVAGVISAAETGEIIRMLDIPVARVLTSPMCRAAETARYMFGNEYEKDTRLMHHNPGRESQRTLDQAASETRDVIGQVAPAKAGANVALITHGGNIFKATGLRLLEGEIGVLQLSDTGEIVPLGQFTGSDLGFYARKKLAQQGAAR